MPPDRRKTLLVVDSDDEIRESLTAALRRDYRVLRAATGEAALQIMQKEDVDLMLLEVTRALERSASPVVTRRSEAPARVAQAFGKELTQEQKAALIEYLKTL